MIAVAGSQHIRVLDDKRPYRFLEKAHVVVLLDQRLVVALETRGTEDGLNY